MNILVTGSKGFVGKNLVAVLENVKSRKDRTRPQLKIDEIYEYDIDTDENLLDTYCEKADFVFHFAGVNRPKNESEFMEGNYGFASFLLDTLKKYHNTCPIMLASSIQASLVGRFLDSEYGRSKLAGEKLFFSYGEEVGAKVLVYRFPNLFGKWCRPNYNSVVATFCYNVANDLPVKINDSSIELELLYIDDLIQEMLDALEEKEHYCDFDGLSMIKVKDGKYCYIPKTYKVDVGTIIQMLKSFKNETSTLMFQEMPDDSFGKKLYSTFLSYFPDSKTMVDLKMSKDERGSFTELLKFFDYGQISVNVSKPGVTKGQHWHNSKWEIFYVVSGHAMIQERKIGIDKDGNQYPIRNYEVTGEDMKAIYMLPGYTHNIINLSKDQNLVTVIWANEQFDSNYPDTFFEKVE